MSTIKFSTSYANTIIAGGTYPMVVAGGAANPSLISGSNLAGVSTLLIYKGSMPTWATLTDRATRDSDLLISFTLPAGGGGWSYAGVTNQQSRYIFGKCSTLTAASASGVATWFILCRAGTTSMTDKGAMMGSVGLVGAGADLSVPDTNIVSGSNYQSAGFYVNFPLVWTV